MHTDDERAVPMLEKILTSQQIAPAEETGVVRAGAEQVAEGSRSPARACVKGSSNPDLQLEALRYFGMFGGAQNMQVLGEIYATSKDLDVKRRILETYMVSGQRDLVLQAAKSESNADSAQAGRPPARRDARHRRTRHALPGGTGRRRQARHHRSVHGRRRRGRGSPRSPRRTGTRPCGCAPSRCSARWAAARTPRVMNELYYASGQTIEARRAVINGLFISGDAKSLIDIARKETDPVAAQGAGRAAEPDEVEGSHRLPDGNHQQIGVGAGDWGLGRRQAPRPRPVQFPAARSAWRQSCVRQDCRPCSECACSESSALPSAQPRIVNGSVTTRAAAGGWPPRCRAIAGQHRGVVWVGYAVPANEAGQEACCQTYRGHTATGGVLWPREGRRARRAERRRTPGKVRLEPSLGAGGLPPIRGGHVQPRRGLLA